MQNYGQHNSHLDYIKIITGITSKNGQNWARGINRTYINNINDDEAILITEIKQR